MIMAKDGEFAHSFQPWMRVSYSYFWGAHGGQVADPMIEPIYNVRRRGKALLGSLLELLLT